MRTLLSALFLVVTTFSLAQDSLFTKVYYTQNHSYNVISQTKDEHGYIAQIGLNPNYDRPTFTYLDSLGNLLFSKQYNSFVRFSAIKPTSDHRFIIAGETFLSSQSVTFGICIKVDSTGNVIWSKIIKPVTPISFECCDIIESTENTLWVSGQDNHTGELSILELDQNGNQLQSFSYSNPGFSLKNKSLIELDTNQLILIGSQFDQDGTPSGHILTLDKSGNALWTKTYENVQFLKAQNDSNSIWIGTTLNDDGLGISTLTTDGSPVDLALCSYFFPLNQNMGFCYLGDSLFAFYSSDVMYGSLLHLIRLNDSTDQAILMRILSASIIPGKHGNFYMAGNGPIETSKSSEYMYQHAGLIRMDTLLDAGSCSDGSLQTYPITHVSLYSDSSSVISTQSASSIDTSFLVVEDHLLQTDNGCIGVYGGLDEQDPNHLILSPNPANNLIRLQFENATSGVIGIVTMDGKLVQQSKVSCNNASISVEKLAPGTYLYQFTSSNNAVSRGKLIIE